ncbi:MAG: reductive dehalogenase [Dehalogenimonas sp.]|uniref:Reductive dehalogenase n=1 Tax=Candidatus Dehalogenimonas loeffleri TaxID=3127115 RepID=A0ABZ2J8A4_9CHLR|nr:reductive dehalogenase [Dehalogenimonas sp.]
MSNFHSTVSRRDFMKALGFAGAGLGVTSLVAPKFNDLDEMIQAGSFNRPWWVKTVDKTTNEVDWTQYKRFREGDTMRGSAGTYMPTYISVDDQKARQDKKKEVEYNYNSQSKAGYTLADKAFTDNVNRGSVSNTFIGPNTSTPESLGIPRWNGTPEENAALLRTAMRFFGSMSVGFTQMDPATTFKLTYSWGPNNRQQLVWEDVDAPYETTDKQVHPNDCMNVITQSNMESQDLFKYNPTWLMAQIRYGRAANIQERTQGFVRTLGYWCLAKGHNDTGNACGFGGVSGLGEMGRMNRMITPEYGPTVGIFRYYTNMPLPNDKPIDAGMRRFCYTCKLCADHCGEGALSHETNPTWDTVGPWNNPGHEAWFEDSRKCRAWKMDADSCVAGRCLGVCTFTKYTDAIVHETVKAVSSTTSVFNGFFRQMDELMGYGLRDPNEFWTTAQPIGGLRSDVAQKYH